MSKLQLIVGYRNRDLGRVERCLESLDAQLDKDFGLTFIDYGSEYQVSEKVRSLVSKYTFCQYQYSDTRGQFWNRSHALNTGVRQTSDSEYIVTTDIDLIFPPSFIAEIKSRLSPDKETHMAANDLKRGFGNWQVLFEGKKIYGKTRSNTALGLVQGVSRKHFEEIGGFDEFYRIWGAEDEDLNCRLQMLGISTEWFDLQEYTIYHQWHPSSSKRTFSLPARWQEFIVAYKESMSEKLHRNSGEWGHLVQTEDRPTIKARSYLAKLPAIQLDHTPCEAVSSVIQDHMEKISPGEVALFTFRDLKKTTIENSRLMGLINSANSVLNSIHSPLMLTNDITFFRRYQDVFQYRDAITYFLVSQSKHIGDYYLDVRPFSLDLLLSK